MSIKILLVGEGKWTCVKEVLGWTLDMEAGVVTLTEQKIRELLTLLDIPAAHFWMVWKDLERLVRNIYSMHLAVPGAMDHLFHIQRDLTQGGVDW